MPIRRRSDGEIVNEKTEVMADKPARQAAGRSSDVPTDPLKPRGKPRGDSLFRPKESGGQFADRLEEPTVPIGARRSGDEGKTRLVAPRRRQDAAPLEGEDPMRDPPVGWLVVIRGPGKGRVLTLGNGMNSLGRGADARVRINFGR